MPPIVPSPGRAPVNLAERFWSLARVMEHSGDLEPKAVVAHVLAVLDRLDAGAIGDDLTANTLSFLALLRQQELRGDLLYASPEQARGEQMDERSLVFSVGVLLFEKLTGRHPFGAEGNPNRLARIRRGELASGVNYFPKVPSALRAVLLRAMGPFPQDRYGSLEELRAELDSFMADRPVRAQTQAEPALPEQLHRRRRPRASDQYQSRDVLAQYDDEFDNEATRVAHVGDRTQMLEKRAPSWLMPAGWTVLGALVATVGFLATGPLLAKTPLPAAALPVSNALVAVDEPAAAAGDAQPANAVVAAAVPAATGAAPAATPAAATETPAARAAAAPPPEAAAPAEPTAPAATAVRAEFDADVAGLEAIAAARACFTDLRLDAEPSFGVSLLFRKGETASSKVYFGASGELRGGERGCLMQALDGVSAGGAPDRHTIVVYSFFLDADGGEHRARVKE